jgi:hypothetical protein
LSTSFKACVVAGEAGKTASSKTGDFKDLRFAGAVFLLANFFGASFFDVSVFMFIVYYKVAIGYQSFVIVIVFYF